MKNLDLLNETAALAGYSITQATGQDAINKARAQRRVTAVKADIVSRYNDWPAQYREGWLPLVALYDTGTVTVTRDSNSVSGSNTVWTSAMKGRKFIAPNGETYKIASVTNSTTLLLTQPYQGTTQSGATYSIWKDEYRLYPEVRALGGFIDYETQDTTMEAQSNRMKESYPKPTTNSSLSVHTTIGREAMTSTYSTGTISGTVNTNIITGLGTAWLSNVEPGYAITIGAYVYHIKKVNSDTEIELYQCLYLAVSAGTTYSAVGKNALIVRFNSPTTQRIVHYWYYAKDYPFVNDSDEDWIAEMFPKVIMAGVTVYDYKDKNDPIRASQAMKEFDDAISDMHVACLNAYTGVRTLPPYIPEEAWE